MFSVLIIEDCEDSADLLRQFVETPSIRVEVALSGSSGIAQAGRLKPEIVLCDIGLPDMDGYAVARAIRADISLSGARLVALSGYSGEGHQKRALEAGFDLQLTKPVELDVLEALVAQVRQDSNQPR